MPPYLGGELNVLHKDQNAFIAKGIFLPFFFLLYFLVIDHNTRSSLVKQGGTGQKQTLEAFFTFYMTLM